jgi:hypothetical protein
MIVEQFLQNHSIQALFLVALAVTVIVETAVILAMIRFVYKVPAINLSLARTLFAGFFASFATIPYLWFVLPAFLSPYSVQVLVGETGAILFEAIAYVFLFNLPFRRTIILSLVANLASITVGLLILPPV